MMNRKSGEEFFCMSSKEKQSKAGIPAKRRGQQTGRPDTNPDQNRQEMKDTPAMRGRRKAANKMFADESAQHVGADAATPKSASPSVPAALPAGKPLGQSGGERVFKKRQGGKKR
jgi:hypothetical protein